MQGWGRQGQQGGKDKPQRSQSNLTASRSSSIPVCRGHGSQRSGHRPKALPNSKLGQPPSLGGTRGFKALGLEEGAALGSAKLRPPQD